MIKSYLELVKYSSFSERFEYLKIFGKVGEFTFGSSRYINQSFYHSPEWLRFRDKIIIRDNGCDLGVEGFEISDSIIVHHINPISLEDLLNRNPCIFDPNNAICTSLSTHNAIHYGDKSFLKTLPIERKLNDTCPWRHT